MELSKKVRENNIKVVITGEGADEMLAGYNIFKESKIRRFWAKQPASKLRPLLLKKLYPYIPQINNANSQFLKFFFGYKLEETGIAFFTPGSCIYCMALIMAPCKFPLWILISSDTDCNSPGGVCLSESSGYFAITSFS